MNVSLRVSNEPVKVAPRPTTVRPKESVRRSAERRDTRARERLVSDWLRSLSSR